MGMDEQQAVAKVAAGRNLQDVGPALFRLHAVGLVVRWYAAPVRILMPS